MITRGWSGARPRTGIVTITNVLCLARCLVYVEIFRERRRLERLIVTV